MVSQAAILPRIRTIRTGIRQDKENDEEIATVTKEENIYVNLGDFPAYKHLSSLEMNWHEVQY